MRRKPLIINSDDVLLNKPGILPEIEEENLTFLTTNQQPPVTTTSEQLLQPEPEVETTQPNGARDVISPVDTANASVPQIYDAQKESELVLQGGTEATPQVSPSVNNKQLANPDILHGIPDLQLSSQPTVDITPAPPSSAHAC